MKIAQDRSPTRPLQGIRVLEVGQLIAGPFAGCILGYFGAEVIKIEPPGAGDPLRVWRELDDGGTSFWWRAMARNKKSVTLDLRHEEGRKIVGDLAGKVDVLLENFRPGTMEKWGLGPEHFKRACSDLVYARVSGYGQTGPYADRPGFASVCEGLGGFRYINGFPGQPPVRPNLSLGDTLAAMNAVIGILLALIQRGKAGGQGQVVDVAIYEAVYNVLEGIVPEYDGNGTVREPSGSTLTGIVPTNTYLCRDGRYVIIGGNGDSVFKRLMQAIGQPEMAEDSRYENNAGRVEHESAIDEVIEKWTNSNDSKKVLHILTRNNVPNGPIYSVKDMLEDVHFSERELFEEVDLDGRSLKIPAITPKLEETPGYTEWPGPSLGAHNEEILHGLLGIDKKHLETLRSARIIM